MKPSTRRAVAYIAGRLATGRESASVNGQAIRVYDHETARHYHYELG
jgi:hypothetical protein